MMPFVEDDARVRREHGGVIPVLRDTANRNVRQQQVMVHHDHVGLRRLSSRGEHEALVEELALDALAQVRLGGDLVPDFLTRLDGQVAQRTVFGLPRPLDQLDEPFLVSVREQRRMRAGRLIEPLQAEIVPPALEQRKPHRLVAERAFQERKVLLDELFLQVDGVGRHHRAFLVGRRPPQRGHQVA